MKNPDSAKYLDSGIIARALGVREYSHPAEADIRSRGFDFDDNSPLTDEQQVVELLRPLNVKGVYTCDLMKVESVDTREIKTMLKVRAVYT